MDRKVAEEVKKDRILEHLVTKILLKTPIKSILRFRCVSQSWNSLVTLPYFIKEHLANAKPLILRTETSSITLFCFLTALAMIQEVMTIRFLARIVRLEEVKRDSIPEYLVTKILLKTPIKSILRFSEGLDRSSQIEFHRPHSFEIVASCNGVVFHRGRHREFDGRRLILWNPSIKKTLYFHLLGHMPILSTTLLGLGYDPEVMTIRFLARIVRLGVDIANLMAGRLILWNPSIKKTLYLPPPRSYASTVTTLLDLGYDPRSDDYKVPARIVRLEEVKRDRIPEHLVTKILQKAPIKSILRFSEGLDRSSQIEFHRPHSFEIIASCNGVVFHRGRHREFDGRRLILWNPSIKKTLYFHLLGHMAVLS
ncbi:hypothetical protein OIU85_006934 [Salix viminalis]|uniref:F-box domain-containing protein n=1 Tax=Salix viminalis TaxID=40686 RepID=A0A9Q0PM41_SALVM|nr:hypothetical protein OIU85_006934 [Salix viminalis]